MQSKMNCGLGLILLFIFKDILHATTKINIDSSHPTMSLFHHTQETDRTLPIYLSGQSPLHSK